MQLLSLFILSLLLFIPRLQAQKTKNKNFHYTDNFDQDLSKQSTKAQKALHLMYGHYSNKKLADELNNPKYNHQESVVVPMWQEKRKGEHWFYGLWFAGDFYDKPLLEVVFLMEAIGRDSFSIKGFKLPETRAREWEKPQPYEDLDPKQLSRNSGCEHIGVWYESEQAFVWSSPEICPLELGEQISLAKVNMLFNSLGCNNTSAYYSPQGELVFAYEQGNFFERLDKKPKKRRK